MVASLDEVGVDFEALGLERGEEMAAGFEGVSEGEVV